MDIQQVQQFFIENTNVIFEVYPTNVKYVLSKSGFPISTFTREKNIGIFTIEIVKKMDILHLNFAILCECVGLRNVH